MLRKNVSVKIGNKSDVSHLKIGIVASRYYAEINDRLLAGALVTLKERGVKEKNIVVSRVAGGFEIPYGCLALIKKKKVDALITLGCIVKGETDHDHHIASAVMQALMNLMIKYEVPISLGLLTVNTLEQAEVRSTGANNKGIEAAAAALDMALS